MPLGPGMPAFPGDPPFESRAVRRLSHGDPYNLTGISMGSHAGTHVDPPCHFVKGGATIDQIDFDRLNGPCEVVDLPASVRVIGAEEVRSVPSGARKVLFRTSNSRRWSESLSFFSDYVALTAEGAERLLAAGVTLVGVDALSIENDPTGQFPVHHRLLGGGSLIVEGLLLHGVPSGPAEISCLPLRLAGGDGGPARAFLSWP